MKHYLLFVIYILFALQSPAQNEMPKDPKTGRITYVGKRIVKIKSKKKIMARMNDWVSAKIDFPPMVFSVINSNTDSLELKAVTEVPSLKSLHPISFRLILKPNRKGFVFRASEFYFEDIKLSLEKWFEEYGEADTERRRRNLEVISTGVESHVFMSMNLLVERINNQ